MILVWLLIFFVACSDDKHAGGATEETQIAIEDKTIAGVSEKGPFVNGSAVRLYELNFETLGQTGRSFTGKIASDRGDFKFTQLDLESQYVLLEANGFYRNEVSGQKSVAPITLNALADVSDKETVNINLLTHLAYERMQNLVDNGLSVAVAKKQAEQEILKSFYIEDESIEGFEEFSIFEEGKGNATLLAISVLMQGNLTEAEFSERLANYAFDMEKDGVWNDSVTKTIIADWASVESYTDYYVSIRKNMEDWGLSEIIPEFEKSVDKFWWGNYGLGVCDKETDGKIKENTNSLSRYANRRFYCSESRWTIIIEGWYVHDDAINDGNSKIEFEEEGVYPVKAVYTLGSWYGDGTPFVSISFLLHKDSTTEDLSDCDALKYSYRGVAHRFMFDSPLITDYDFFGVQVDKSNEWREQILYWTSFKKEGWGYESSYVTLEDAQRNVREFSWQIKDYSGQNGFLEVSGVSCISQNFSILFL